ncbi:MAG: diguanylate cyclase [Deltaproteobacteria bacterium]|nr:diguanylate cyclase [Candidatus Anaeroferrophillacea bacterium]
MKHDLDMLTNGEMLRQLVGTCPDGIIGVNRTGIVSIFNEAAEKLTGFDAAEVLKRISITELYDSPERPREIKRMLHSEGFGGTGRIEGIEVAIRRKTGGTVPIRLSATLLHSAGRETGSVGFFHDLTDHKELEEELRRQSITDSLTDLFNRRHFHTVLTDEVGRCRRYNHGLSLAFCDLDRFKSYNDTFGHHEGDNILRLVAETCVRTFRSTDVTFRLGGDEFAVVLIETEAPDATRSMERLRQAFNELWPKRMVSLGKRLEPVTLSIGVAQLLVNEPAEKLQLRADLAMYEAKNRGGNRTVTARGCIGADHRGG